MPEPPKLNPARVAQTYQIFLGAARMALGSGAAVAEVVEAARRFAEDAAAELAAVQEK